MAHTVVKSATVPLLVKHVILILIFASPVRMDMLLMAQLALVQR